jgi:hypothetical protein
MSMAALVWGWKVEKQQLYRYIIAINRYSLCPTMKGIWKFADGSWKMGEDEKQKAEGRGQMAERRRETQSRGTGARKCAVGPVRSDPIRLDPTKSDPG